MQITFLTCKFRNGERNLHCDVLHITTVWVSSLTLDCNGVFALKAYRVCCCSINDVPAIHARIHTHARVGPTVSQSRYRHQEELSPRGTVLTPVSIKLFLYRLSVYCHALNKLTMNYSPYRTVWNSSVCRQGSPQAHCYVITASTKIVSVTSFRTHVFF